MEIKDWKIEYRKHRFNPTDLPDGIYFFIDDLVLNGPYEYVSGYRAYRVGDQTGKAGFEKRREAGCCASHESIHYINGEMWTIGFNYGH